MLGYFYNLFFLLIIYSFIFNFFITYINPVGLPIISASIIEGHIASACVFLSYPFDLNRLICLIFLCFSLIGQIVCFYRIFNRLTCNLSCGLIITHFNQIHIKKTLDITTLKHSKTYINKHCCSAKSL